MMNKAADGTAAGFPPGAPTEHYGTSEDRESHHTTHFSIVDPYGNVAVITSTIEWVFGNGMVVPGMPQVILSSYYLHFLPFLEEAIFIALCCSIFITYRF